MKVVPLDVPLGARIEGICWQDATKPDVVGAQQGLGEYLLVLVPGQPMCAPLMRDFASAFGTPRAQLLRYKRNNEVPEVSTMVSTLMADGTTDKTALRSEDWHADDSYMAVPAKATLLHKRETPSRGGRNWFCKYILPGSSVCCSAIRWRCSEAPRNIWRGSAMPASLSRRKEHDESLRRLRRALRERSAAARGDHAAAANF